MDEMGMWHTSYKTSIQLCIILTSQILRFIHFIEIPQSIYNDGGKCDDQGEHSIGCNFNVQYFAHKEVFNCACYWSVNVRYHKICGQWGAFGVTLLIFINKEKPSVSMHAHKHIHTHLNACTYAHTYTIRVNNLCSHYKNELFYWKQYRLVFKYSVLIKRRFSFSL